RAPATAGRQAAESFSQPLFRTTPNLLSGPRGFQGKRGMATAKKNLNWAEIGFSYRQTDFRFSAIHDNGVWSEGELVESPMIAMHEGSPAIHYAQQCFEGMKAQTAPDGRVLLFRPHLNSERMNTTADRLVMPAVPYELFLRGVEETV